jgi:Protein tyrosine and serine/threonine kinase
MSRRLTQTSAHVTGSDLQPVRCKMPVAMEASNGVAALARRPSITVNSPSALRFPQVHCVPQVWTDRCCAGTASSASLVRAAWVRACPCNCSSTRFVALLQDEITVLGRIGEGAFGEVSLASSPIFGQVAIKWLKPGKVRCPWPAMALIQICAYCCPMKDCPHPQAPNCKLRQFHLTRACRLAAQHVQRSSESFWGEAEVLASVNHPNVLRFYGVVTQSKADPTCVGIMTEYMRGGSLANMIR